MTPPDPALIPAEIIVWWRTSMTYTIMSRIRQSLQQPTSPFKQGGDLEDNHGYRQTPVKGIPTFISEYGGIKWDEEGVEKDGWGYGAGPATKEGIPEPI